MRFLYLDKANKLQNWKFTVDGKIKIKELTGDGALVATPAGSTAYNLSARRSNT